MATPTLDTFVHDIVIYKGASFGEQYQLYWCEDGEKEYIDVTQCSFRAEIKESAADECPIVSFKTKIIDATEGLVELYLDAATTAKIESYGDNYKQMTKYYWDLYITFPDNETQRVVVGTAYVSPGVAIGSCNCSGSSCGCKCSSSSNKTCGNSGVCYYCGAK